MTKPKQYLTLTQAEQDDRIVATFKEQEMNLFLHSDTLERFEFMLTIVPAGDFKDKLETEVPILKERIQETEAVISSLQRKLPPPARFKASLARLKAEDLRLQTRA